LGYGEPSYFYMAHEESCHKYNSINCRRMTDGSRDLAPRPRFSSSAVTRSPLFPSSITLPFLPLSTYFGYLTTAGPMNLATDLLCTTQEQNCNLTTRISPPSPIPVPLTLSYHAALPALGIEYRFQIRQGTPSMVVGSIQPTILDPSFGQDPSVGQSRVVTIIYLIW
jgi:hypothetical protein